MSLCAAISALAWNETGHRAIALLAFEHLEPRVREEVAAILAGHPHSDTLLRERLIPGQVDPARIFANSAAWPDKVTKSPHASAYHRASWHYVNIPYVPDEYAAQLPPAAFTETGDLIRALEFNLTVLGNPKNAHEERAIALCWVAHLVGDIHQPLHAVTLFTPRTPHGDKGGNALWVRKTPTAKLVTNLHSIWDAVLGDGSSSRSVEVIASRIRVAHPVSIAPPGGIENTTPRSWADESVATAIIHVYRMGGLPFAVAETSKKPRHEEAPGFLRPLERCRPACSAPPGPPSFAGARELLAEQEGQAALAVGRAPRLFCLRLHARRATSSSGNPAPAFHELLAAQSRSRPDALHSPA